MGFSIDVTIPALTVFLQGLLSFFSPCVLPLIPLYIGYLSGGTAKLDEDGRMHYDRRKVLVNTIFFILGISFAFLLLGTAMTAVGRFFGSKQILFARIGGVIVILFGLYQLGALGSSGFLSRDVRLPFHTEKMVMSPFTALLMGFVFSFAWTPCVGPVLSGVLLMTASASSKAAGFLMIGVYTLGFVLPFLAVGLFTTSLLELFKKHKGVVKYTVRIGGVLMILMGILMLTGKMNGITGYLSAASASEPDREEVREAAEPEDGAEEDRETEASGGETDGTGEEMIPDKDDEDPEYMPAVDFELTDQYGNTHRLSDYRGKAVFLNFWATWCPPCRAEMPDIQKLYEEYQAKEDPEVIILGVAFPGYSNEQSKEGIREFLEENGYTYPTVMDEEGSLIQLYYITSYPTTYMINAEGNVVGFVPGGITEDIMRDIIRETIESVK